jgi:flagellar M-ring protein FliF
MNDYLRQLWEPITKLSKTQRIILGSVVGLVVVAIIVAAMWGTDKEYIPLFQEELKLDDASKINAKLTELGLDHKIGKTANEILVPTTDKSYILLKLSEEKTLPEAKAGWEKLIDQRSLFQGTTQQEFDLNFVRGLQEEIVTALKRMGPIEDANVNIVKPKKTTFKEDQKEPSASVLLKLKPNTTVEPNQIRAIRDFICSAVEGLEPDKVKICDDHANDLTRVIEDEDLMTIEKSQTIQIKITRDRERYLQGALQRMLESMFGDGKAIVQVRLEMDFDQKEAVSDVVVPLEGTNQGIVISQKTENEEYEGRDLIEDGEPGVNSNLPPGSPAYPGTENGVLNKYKRDGTITNYEVTKSKEKFIKEQGTIRRLTASVVINGDPSEYKNTEDQILAIAQTAIGYDKSRGDKMNLMVMPFRNDDLVRAREEMALKKEQEKQMFKIIMGLLMAFPILIGLIYIVARITKARSLAKEQERLAKAAEEAERLRKEREKQLLAQNEKQWKEYEKRFSDVKNWFPEITNLEEKKRKVQDLKLKAYKYASENDELPPDFEEMSPEEKYAFREAFQKKADGKLQGEIERLEKIVSERDREREGELSKLNAEAIARDELEKRVRELIERKPDDAIQVIRGWLNNK